MLLSYDKKSMLSMAELSSPTVVTMLTGLHSEHVVKVAALVVMPPYLMHNDTEGAERRQSGRAGSTRW